MIEYIEGNALDWAEKEGYCMIHVCNNKGGFGGGKTALATQVKERVPEVYQSYLKHYKDEGTACGSLDSVVNLIAQDGYGARWKGVKYFKEEWFEKCLSTIRFAAENLDDDQLPHTIVVPYLMGADRAGGDWGWIISKVEEVLGLHFNIMVVKYVP